MEQLFCFNFGFVASLNFRRYSTGFGKEMNFIHFDRIKSEEDINNDIRSWSYHFIDRSKILLYATGFRLMTTVHRFLMVLQCTSVRYIVLRS